MFRYARTAEELLEQMAFCGIERALVYHTAMRFDSPIVGNEKVLAGARGHPELIPTWAILPSQTGEFPNPSGLLAGMKANGVRALRAFPKEQNYFLDTVTFRDLLDVLQENRIPLLAKQDLRGIGELLASFPRLVLVAMNLGPHSLERFLRPLVEAYPNLYVDTSYYIVEGLIEEFCNRYGSHRLLFGTAFPDNCSGGALLRVAQADISPEDREAIAGKNLERLLSEAQL
jgi:hypothetical protein